jgi:hypothetical protein
MVYEVGTDRCASVDFRSFRTMHSSVMSSVGVRPEVTRDNMGHANVDVTQNVYNRTWWEERAQAVSLAAATVWREFWQSLCRLRERKSFWKSSNSRRLQKLLI